MQVRWLAAAFVAAAVVAGSMVAVACAGSPPSGGAADCPDALNANLDDIVWHMTTCPDGTNSDTNGRGACAPVRG